MIQSGYVLLNGEHIKPGHKLKLGEMISIDWPLVDESRANLLTTLYEDSDCIVFNKPAGILVHSKGKFNPEYTVADYLKKIFNKPNSDLREGVVHRLDRNTSGVLIAAKNEQTQAFLQSQFAQRKTQKAYIAVVQGRVEDTIIDVPLKRSLTNPKKFQAHEDGKPSTTKVISLRYDDALRLSVVLVLPITGRTHQIRCHMEYIGHPIYGDKLYGASNELPSGRFLLHAYSLGIRLANSKDASMSYFIAPIPQDMSSYVSERDTTTINSIIQQK
jgi:23S rRNA pseudouridine1911/1915/1917 synthase